MDASQPQRAGYGEREVSDQDKKLSSDYQRRVETALSRPCVKDTFHEFEHNRTRLRGFEPGDGTQKKRLRSNLYYSNLASIRPQIYAKDPEFSVEPTSGVPTEQVPLVRKFGETAQTVLTQMLVVDCKLKKKAKRQLTSAYATSVGWLKLSWQEERQKDPQIQARMDDTQDNIARLQQLRDCLEDPQAGSDQDLELAQLRETLAGLQSQSEIVIWRGLVLDFVLSEDILVLDSSVREVTDYERSEAIAHRVWMTRAAYVKAFGYDPKKAKTYKQAGGEGKEQAPATMSGNKGSKDDDLLCVWEIWDKSQNRVHTICMGEEGFCRPSFSPDWTARRWYPFYLLAWNEVDGGMYPLADVSLIKPLVDEYNEARDDFVQDRRDSRPFTVGRKGGSLTDNDLANIRNRKGNDLIMVEGAGNNPITNDLAAITLGSIDPRNYDTAPARADIEQILGGGDASRGSVLQAKTATEAEILSQGLRGRSAERQDIQEDLLSDLGSDSLQICLRKLSESEVKRIAGPDAQWPQLSAEEIFDQVTVRVRAGSTGRPDRLQEQDRWTKLQPVIKETVITVADLYSKGQVQLGQALVEMLRETLRRFDERIDLDALLPKPPEQGQQDPTLLMQQVQELQMKVKDLTEQLEKAQEEVEKGYVTAATSIATSANPAAAAIAFVQSLQVVRSVESSEKTPEPQSDDMGTPMPPEQSVTDD
ncbi:hypothetical protein [Roseateles depolymerans]|uniref:Uncharacterized protein n=1 Tax=Roseateles depolymerans TaxID=76731 RepID=A0A0U3CZD4_9BURK|nr:hypothetical protein [Roseateles depolymerans]ALV06694.1 hypothetical protein RD2015_2222 [Roseateles depolymerans]REG19671.1 hypothetical protein DES44_2171 [Roseateles depolymerans]